MSNSSPGIHASSTLTSLVVSIMSGLGGGQPFHPALPYEMWDMVLQMMWDDFHSCKSQEDLTHLWTCVRPVSMNLRKKVEEIFKTQHLPMTVLHFFSGQYSPASSLSLSPLPLEGSMEGARSLVAPRQLASYEFGGPLASFPRHITTFSIIHDELPWGIEASA